MCSSLRFAALTGGATKLVTGERWDKPMFRVKELTVLSIRSPN
jgi:hypothetical protein